MFRFWKSKSKSSARDAEDRASQPSRLSDEALLDIIRRTFEIESDIVGALFLVAYENFNIYYSVFIKALETSKDYPTSLEGMAAYLDAYRGKYSGTSVNDEANARRFFYLYVAALLKIAHARAKAKPELWDGIATVWVALLPGARALRRTIDTTNLWTADETVFFQSIRTEDEGENYCLALMAPSEIRYHRKVTEWQERDLSPEVRADLREMAKLLRGE